MTTQVIALNTKVMKYITWLIVDIFMCGMSYSNCLVVVAKPFAGAKNQNELVHLCTCAPACWCTQPVFHSNLHCCPFTENLGSNGKVEEERSLHIVPRMEIPPAISQVIFSGTRYNECVNGAGNRGGSLDFSRRKQTTICYLLNNRNKGWHSIKNVDIF